MHRLLLAFTLVFGLLIVPALPGVPARVAEAAGSPDVALAKDMPAEMLYGVPIPVSLSLTNPGGPDGFNVMFTDVLPVGVSFVSGTPAPTETPQSDGTTLLVWSNVADMLTGAAVTLSYEIDVDQAVFASGDTVTNSAQAFVNSNPRTLPKIDPSPTNLSGDALAGSFSGNDSASASTLLIPFELTKEGGTAEDELLRGVHDQQTVYTLTVDNNAVNATTGFTLVDYLPASLEFLGCAPIIDSSSVVVSPAVISEEYPGSGIIPSGAATTNPCAVPSSVTTVDVDPDGAGPMPSGVYTKVEWNSTSLAAAVGSADLAASGTFSIDYITAIPLQQNTFPGPTPATANLDNNTGAYTTETAGETSLSNYAEASGTYFTDGSPTIDSDIDMATIEDLSIHKTVDFPDFTQDSTPVFTLLVESSEYALETGPITVTDTIPSALDFVSATPAPDDLAGVDNGDGTITFTWTLDPFTDPNSSATITLNTDVREDFRGTTTPVSSNDAYTNTTTLAADVTVITDNTGTTEVLPLIDDSSAGQSASGPSILKEVSEPQASLTCGDGAGITFNSTTAGNYRPGDRVCYRLTVDFPNELDTIDPIIDDYLPDGFAVEGWAVGANNNIDFTGATVPVAPFDDDVPRMRWNLSNVDRGDSGSDTFEVVIEAIISDPSANDPGDIADNLMKFRYSNAAGGVFQKRDAALAVLSEAILDLDKGVIALNGGAVVGGPADGVTVQEGDTVTYQLAVSNTGNEPATNVSVRDVLPVGVVCGNVITASITSGGVCVTPLAPLTDYIQWDTDDGIAVAAAGAINLTYDVVMPTGISAGATLTNTAGVRQYSGDTNTGTPFVYVPGTNIDTTLTPTNTDAADDTSNVVTALPTIVKSRTTSINEAGNAANNQATIGETVSYTIDTTLAGGVSFYNAVIDDNIDTEKDLVESSVVVTRDGAAVPIGPVPTGFQVDTTGNGIEVTFPTPYVIPNGAGQAFEITFDVVITDVTSNTRTTGSDNRVDFDYENSAGTARNVNDSVGLQIVEPNITLGKSNDDADGVVTAGQTVTYTLDVENDNTVPNANVASNRVSTAHDTVVVDTVPPELIVQPATISDSGVYVAGATASDPGTITWNIATIAPGAAVALTYDVITANPLVASSALENTAVADTTSMAGAVPGERTSASTNGDAVGDGYTDPADSTVTVPVLTLAKSADPAIATVGEPVTYTVDVTIPGGNIAYDVTVIDDMPAGITFESLTSVTCAEAGGACSPDLATADALVVPAGPTYASGDDIAFFFDDLDVAAAADRVVTITYVGFVSDVAAANAGSTLTNGATVNWNGADTITTPPTVVPDPTTFAETSPEGSDSLATIEPDLAIDKAVGGQVGDTDTRRAKPGDVLTYTLTVTNTGSAPAYDVTVADTMTDTTWAFADTTVTAGITNTDSDPAGGLEWTIDGPIPAQVGAVPGTATITYTLTVPAGFDSSNEVVAGPEQSNTADIPSYFAVPEATRTLNPDRDYRDYDNVTSDTVTIELDLASIGDDVWFDVNDDGIQQATEPVLANVDVIVTYLGLDGVLDTGPGDDEVYPTTTDANGQYVVINLPGGEYLVDVVDTDTDIFPGLAPSVDLDNGTAATDGISAATLGEDDDKRDVDFGYTGSASIGNQLWFDQDLDGVFDPNEAPLVGVTVTLTYTSPNGDVVVYTDTTDANGQYDFPNLPAGVFTVTVDPLGTTVPEGYAIVSDPDGDDDNTTTVTLAAGATNNDQDFGYAGVGTVGDFIWLDQSNDGAQDPGEPGLGGVAVQLTSFGPDGVEGGDDDSVFTTTTGANGAYLFSNLPPGAFEVEITAALPANVVNTFDPDVAGPGDSTSSVTLTLAEPNDLDQDFGYYGASTLGNRVWLDANNTGSADDGTEPGINNVEVTATYFGPDGDILTTVDNEVFVTTTSGNGDYLFETIPDGEYQVQVTGGIAPGLTQTFDSSGALTDGISTTTLVTEDLLQDFSYTGAGSIGDTVWFDSGNFGVLDAGETGLEDVTVNLTWYGLNDVPGGGDDIVLTTTTDANGVYSFPNLPDGAFLVEVVESTLPNGMAPTYDRDGLLAAPDGSTPVALAGGAAITDVDFGYRGAGSIGDTIWFDRDGDGVFDTDEYPLENVTVELVWASPTGPQTYTTVTNAAGMYLFPNLPPGDYDVNVVTSSLPVGSTPTFDGDQAANGLGNTSAVTLADGGNDLGQDFGYDGSASIGNTIYLDLNGDGVQGPGEAGIGGQTVVLTWQSPSGPVTFMTTTDVNGNYLFDNLPDGDYTVTVTGGIVDLAVNTGDPTAPGVPSVGDSANAVTIAGGLPNSDQDFGYQGINSIGDTVFWDQNNNGVDDATDPGLENIEVTLIWFGLDGVEGNSDDVTLPVDTTDAAGDYGFTGLPDGSYSVAVTDGLPTGLDDNTFDGDDLTVSPNGISIVTDLGVGDANAVNNDAQDFGYTGTGSIGDDVWFDVNDDGVQDPGEPVLANVDVLVRFFGFDDAPNTADDVLYPATTDASGKYVVNNLPAGRYLVDVDEADVDFIVGLVPAVDLDDGLAATDGVSAAILADGENKRDVDFGYTGTGSIAQTVWFDQNADGVVDANEAGIEDATVTVTWAGPDGDPATAGDNVVYVTTTDENGEYLVENLPAGDFTVVVSDLPSGYNNVSEPGVENDNTNTLTLGVGENNAGQNFGYAGVGSVGNFIWLDQNSDGVQDAGEPGLGGVMVQLTSFGPDGVEGGDDDSVFMTTTDANGGYLFSNLPPGWFEVEVTGALPANATNTFNPEDNGPGDSTSSVELTLVLPNDATQDFGYNTASALGDRVWLDVDNSGGVDDGTEPGINNVQVTATYFGPDGDILTTVDNEVFVTTTAGNGDYLFENIPDGEYQVQVTGGIAPGLTQTFDSSGALTDGTSNTTLATEDLLQDFSYTGAGSIGDTVWFDSGNFGVLDAGETGLEDATVTLTWFGLDGVSGGTDDIVLTTTTDANGNYNFPNLPDGAFLVEVVESTLPNGMAPTYDRDGLLAAPDSSTPVTLTGGAAITDVDFGYRGAGSIGDTVWFDRDGDGVIDADEYPLENVTVELVWDSPTGPQTYSTVTDAAGEYLFPNLPPGDYDVNVVTATLPVGLTATFDGDQGANGLGDTSAVTLADGEDNASQDFGYNGAASIGDSIYLDLNGDGVQGPGEAGIEGQTVVLTWQGPSGPVTFTTTTDANGNYVFGNLPDGDYTVTVTGGIVDLATNTGFPVGGGSSLNTITLAGGVSNLDQDFGYQGINSIGDTVFWDQNNDGVDDATDPGLENIEATLTWFGLDGNAGNSDDIALPVDTTDATGDYGFGGLPDGSYSVAITGGLPTGLDDVTFDADDLAVNPDGVSIVTDLGVGDANPVNDADQDFGYTGSGSIGDDVWFDVNNDGVQQASEPVLANVGVIVRYLGLDDVPNTTDDVVYSAVTGVDGKYVVNNLPAGDYIVDVDESDPDFIAGLVPTFDLDDGVVAPDGVSGATLVADEDKRDVDFGYTGTGSIAQTVWFDQNQDGVVDANEAGLDGATVTVGWGGPDGDLLTTADNVVYVATTDANGEYTVEDLPPGEYSVVVSGLPPGYDNVSEPGVENDSANTLTLGDGEANTGQNFGYAGVGTVGDFIWLDQNSDGVQDSGEPGLGGVMVQLTSFGPDGLRGGDDDSVFMTTTDANGAYLFSNLPPGVFEVEVTGALPVNVTNTFDPDVDGPGDSTSTVTLTLAEPSDDTQDFGYNAASALGDRVWLDVNGDGVADVGSEPGINNVEVTATYFGPDGLLGTTDDEIFVTTTAGNGDYLFENVPDGSYQVAVTGGIAPGLTQTFDSSGAQTDGISNTTLATEDLLQDFSYTGAGSIGDTVWFDSNEDGVLDAGETGLEDVTVTLTWFGLDGASGGGDDIVLTTMTDAAGNYSFANLPDGEFVVAVNTATLPTGMTATFDSDGGIATPNSSTPVTLTAGAAIDTVDFGYSGAGSIGETIWFDRDGDGVFDADEYALENVTVELVWASPTGPQTYTATTDTAGMYRFPNLAPGDYDVNVVTSSLPVGLTPTFDGDQAANGLGDTSALTLADGENNAAQDFGYNGSASIGAAIFLDLDGDGVQGPGEAGIEGQTVVLTWQGPSGPVTFTTVTDVNGNYVFDNLPDGDYTVTVTGGIVDLATNTGFPVGGGSSINNVTIAGGVSNLDQDFGYQGLNSIGDTVFWDQNNDGVDDATDPGLENVALTLTWFGLDGVAGNSDDVILPIDTTDATGDYGFAGLPDGSYSVEVTSGLPAGLDTNTFDGDDLAVNPNGISIVTGLGVGNANAVNNVDQDFGYTGTGSIGDTIYFDTDGNGTQGPGEPGIPGATVTLTWGGPDGDLSTSGDNVGFPLQTTLADGMYDFSNLPAGPFQVDVGNPLVGTTPTQDPDGGADSTALVSLTAGGNNDAQDFGYTGTGSIGDTIWFDQNLDGTQNPGEDGLGGVGVTVTWAGPDGDLALTADNIEYPVTTDLNGKYLVDKLPAGNYSVVVDTGDLPADYVNVAEPGGENDSQNELVLGAGENNTVQDFGYSGSGSIGDTIYLDQNGDGDQDTGEPGLVGVTVELVSFGPDGVLGGTDDSFFETVTGPGGDYLFDNLPEGTYQVTVTGGITAVVNTDDPDVAGVAAGDSTSTTTLTTASPSDIDQDFGYFADSVLGDKVWWDRNSDGVQDADEPGFGGVVVQLDSPSFAAPIFATTDADGNYLFINIPNSVGVEEYTVTILSGVPDGFSQTFDADGVGETDETSMIALADADLMQDFGYNGTGSIGDTIWFDTDGSGGGSPDGAEFGLQGVTVNLTWVNPDGDPLTDDDIVITTMTDSNGLYSFANLPNGDFIVGVDETTLPAGLTETYDLNGELDGQGTTEVTLTDAVNAVDNVDFGYNGSGSIGDTIWFDRNGDGVFDANEYPLSGIGVTLTWNSSQGVETFTTTTGPDGTYLFDNLAPGDYTVAVTVADLPAGMLPTFDADQAVNGLNSTSTLTLGDGEDNADQDFGYNGQGQIGDSVYIDLDGNGVQDPGEPGVANQTVLLGWDGPNGRVTFAVTTDANGMYLFDGLPAGNYDITVVNGIVNDAVNTGDPTAPGIGDSTNTLTLTSGQINLGQDFGYQGENTIGDRIWFDTNADGVDDAGEPGLASVEVTAVWFGPDNLPGTADDVSLPTQLTAADGSYSFTGLPDGNFSVTVTDGLPAGLTTNTFDGDDLAVDPDGTSIVTGLGVGVAGPAEDLGQDFGYTGTGQIGDAIWLDLDGDGAQDPGEPGIPGVEVTVTGAGPDGILGTPDDVVYPTQTTGPDGTYLFENLPSGDFQVDVVNPVTGLTLSTDPDGTADGTTTVNLDPGEVDLGQDFAYVGDASIGDTIFLDVDGNGVQDTNEPGLGGITVTVTAGGVDGVLGTPDDIVVMVDTDANGVYLVDMLPAGPVSVTYDVTDLDDGLDPGSDLDGGDATVTTVALGAGEMKRDVDFAIVGDATISGIVYQDTNGNGTQDAGEPGIGGVTIEVTFDGPDGPVVLTTTTNPDGTWSLTTVPPGDYVTTVLASSVPAGLVPSTPVDVNAVVPAGGEGTTNNGFVPTGSIGDTVFNDTDGDGVQDPGEPGISGVTITVTDGTGGVITVVTGPNGIYVVDDLPPGDYIVRVDPTTLPSGVVITADPDGTPDGTTNVTVGPGGDITTIDFGGRVPPAQGGGIPATGANIALTLMLAALLLGAGWFLLGTTRRHRRRNS